MMGPMCTREAPDYFGRALLLLPPEYKRERFALMLRRGILFASLGGHLYEAKESLKEALTFTPFSTSSQADKARHSVPGELTALLTE